MKHAENHRDRYSDRRQFDMGGAVISGEHVNRRRAERRESDRFRRRFKAIFDLNMKETTKDEELFRDAEPALQMILSENNEK